MCSYNAAYGKPTCADDTANNQLARGQWGFKGFFVSDCTALELMQDAKWDNCPHPWPSEGVSWRLQLLLYGPNDFHRPNAQLPLTHFVVCVLSLLTSLLRAIVLRIRSLVVTTTRSLSVIRCMRCVENLVQDCVESVCVFFFFFRHFLACNILLLCCVNFQIQSMVEGGVDYNCGSLYKTNLFNTIQDGSARINSTVLDSAVRRVYRTMFEVCKKIIPLRSFYYSCCCCCCCFECQNCRCLFVVHIHLNE